MVVAMRKGSPEQQKSLLTAHPDLAGKLAPSLEQIDTGTAQLIDVGARWQAAKAEAATLVADSR